MTQLFSYIVHTYKALNEGEEVDATYFYFARAFEKLDYTVLLAKRQKYGIEGKALKWI
jgi:hypothetical protein